MTVENIATPAADSPASAAAPATDDKGVAADAPAADTEEDLLGETAKADEPAEGDDKAGDQDGDEDDLLDGKVKKDEEGEGDTAAPDDYEFTIPEGYELDAELADISKPAFKEAGLTQDQAQNLVEKLGPQILTKLGEKQAAQWKAVQSAWAKEFKADPEYGGKNLDASLGNVARARDYLGPEFTASIKLLGGNNNPAVLKALAKVGKALGEDAPGFGKPAAVAKSAAERLYPNDQPKTKE